MSYRTLLIAVILSQNFIFLAGQAIHYDYDDSGNRVKRYIVLGKGNNSDEEKSYVDTDAGKTEDSKVNNKVEEFEDKLGELTIKIYPNPTHGDLYVEICGLGPDETVDYQLFSKSGSLLEIKKNLGYQFNIELEKNPAGMYILNLLIQGKMSQWKILKE
jgi:hypothetical protein